MQAATATDDAVDAIDRAKVSAQAQGHDTPTLFAGAVKKSAGRDGEDFHLARFATDRLNGEWFAPSQDVLDFIDEVAA